VKYPSIVIDDERSIGHWFIRSNSDKLVKPRFKVHKKATDMLKDDHGRKSDLGEIRGVKVIYQEKMCNKST
jgi:hypothetical protein